MNAPVDEPSGGSDARRLAWLRRLVWVVLLAGIVAFLVQGADNPPDPFLVPEERTGAEAASGPSAPEGEDEPPGSDDPGTSSTTTSGDSPGLPTTPTTGASSAPISPATPAAGPTLTTAPAPPETTAPVLPARRPLDGFDEVAFRITDPSGVADGVAMLADDGPSRSRGLMEQTDLRGYDAMVFRFPAPSEGGFFMRNTLIPLSIAFFDTSGRFVSSADMEPCPDEVEDCPSFFADAPYLHAIEVAQGDLPRLGIGPGSVLSFP